MAKHGTIRAVSKHLHSARLAPYVRECHNDPERTLALYKWNVQLSAEFQKVLGVTEVVLRNAIDRELRKWNAQQTATRAGTEHGHPEEWTLDAASPLNALTKDARKTASYHASEAATTRPQHHPRVAAAVNHDDLIAQLNFGVWARLLPTGDTNDKHYKARQILWNEAVQYAFPHRDHDPDGYVVAGRATRLQALRNRVSHMEPLLGVNAVARHNDALRLIGTISPETRDWCAGLSRVVETNKLRPSPA